MGSPRHHASDQANVTVVNSSTTSPTQGGSSASISTPDGDDRREVTAAEVCEMDPATKVVTSSVKSADVDPPDAETDDEYITELIGPRRSRRITANFYS